MDEEEKEIEQKMIKVIKMMPEGVQDRFKVLKVLSDKRQKLNDQFDEELKELTEKMEAKKKPLYEQRRNIISGEITDFSEQVTEFGKLSEKLEAEYKEVRSKKPASQDPLDPANIPDIDPEAVDVSAVVGKEGIPNFWPTAIKNCQFFQEVVKSDKDIEILKHLTELECSTVEKPEKIITVRMVFEDNDFMENTDVSFSVKFDGKRESEVKSVDCTEIAWKEGKNPMEKKVKKKQKNKKTNETRTIVKTVESESFFTVIKSRVAPAEDAEEDEEFEKTMESLDQVAQLAEDIVDDFYPNALDYYLGIIQGEEDFDDEEGDEDGSEGDSGSDGDMPKPKKGKKGGAGAGAGGKEDCKQQ